MSDNSFFQESSQNSELKSAIVTTYFSAWSRVIVASLKRFRSSSKQKLAYIDLFCGPGRYIDGTASTPLQVLQMAIGDPDLRDRLVTLFNDRNEDHTASLKGEIDELPDINTLKYPPRVVTHEIGPEIARMFETTSLIPTLFFVDPWGYKGLSLRLVHSIVKDWGSDCIFFFNYNRINMGLANPVVLEHMNALFGVRRAGSLRQLLGPINPHQREVTIIEALCQALKDLGSEYVLPFRFKDHRGTRTSHHLIFVSKHFKGYEIMKQIMAKRSSEAEQGVSNFEYNPAASLDAAQQPLLFQLTRPLEELGEMILDRFAGRTLTMKDIYREHNVGTPYIEKNYKQALILLEKAGMIKASPHRKGSFAGNVVVQFSNR